LRFDPLGPREVPVELGETDQRMEEIVEEVVEQVAVDGLVVLGAIPLGELLRPVLDVVGILDVFGPAARRQSAEALGSPG
jgi:hypothetical protein